MVSAIKLKEAYLNKFTNDPEVKEILDYISKEVDNAALERYEKSVRFDLSDFKNFKKYQNNIIEYLEDLGYRCQVYSVGFDSKLEYEISW